MSGRRRVGCRGWLVLCAWGLWAAGCAIISGGRQDPALPLTTVYLVHGISADSSVFGSFRKALEVQLRQADPSRRYDVRTFDYDTASNEKDTVRFARDLDAELERRFGGHMAPEDRLSFVMHSQGGLVVGIWLASALMGQEGFHSLYARHVDAYVTVPARRGHPVPARPVPAA